MTEIPEHLLARSKSARARMTGIGGADEVGAASVPATTTSTDAATKAPAAAPVVSAPPASPPPPPKVPMVEAAERRTKIPVWAMPVLLLMPLWMVVYMATNDVPSPKKAGPLTLGGQVYAANCAGCHGAAGAGSGAFPALNDGVLPRDFPDPGDQVRWVLLGSQGYRDEGKTTYSASNKPIKGGMPAFESLEPAELLDAIRYEREKLSGEEFDATLWEEAVTKLEGDANPKVAEKAAEFAAVLESWATAAPGT